MGCPGVQKIAKQNPPTMCQVSGTVTGAWGTSVNKKTILALAECTLQQNQSKIVFFFLRKSIDLNVREGLGQITNPNQPDDLWVSYLTS